MERYNIILSPTLLIQFKNGEDACEDFLIRLLSSAGNYKHGLMIMLPGELRYIISSRYKHLEYLIYSSSQHPISFINEKLNCSPQPQVQCNGISITSYIFIDQFCYFLSQCSIPIVASNETIEIQKSRCDISAYRCKYPSSSNFCSTSLKLCFPEFNAANLDTLVEKMKKAHIDSNLFMYERITSSNFITLAKFILEIHDLEFNRTTSIDWDRCKFCPGFFDDINKDPSAKLGVLFSSGRMLAFPPTDNRRNRIRGSIDSHTNNPSSQRIDGKIYKLYRLDVLDSISIMGNGHNSSGPRRILYAKESQLRIFIAYTDDHDFNSDLVRTRLSQL
jgi:hypothetical protein